VHKEHIDQTKSRFMAIRHELATSNWRVDMSEVLKYYPINLNRLDEWISRTVKQG